MIPTIFDRLTLDVDKFINHPKCKSTWKAEDGSKCLISALLAGFGLDINKHVKKSLGNYDYTWFVTGGGIGVMTIEAVGLHLNQLAENLGVDLKVSEEEREDRFFDNPRHINFSNLIVCRYDSYDESGALDLVCQLIDKFPNKTGNVIKEKVVMPVCSKTC